MTKLFLSSELAHIALHFKVDEETIFLDQLDNEDKLGFILDKKETEADDLASEAIVSESKWAISAAKSFPSQGAAESLAKEMGIHVAVIAGYIQHKHQNYYYLNKIVQSDEAKVRHLIKDYVS